MLSNYFTFKAMKISSKIVSYLRKWQQITQSPNNLTFVHFRYFVLELCDASLDQLFLDPNHQKKYNGPKLPYHFEIFSQLASGLEYIHSKNLIHRDIKPANVLISVDSICQKVTIKWADFGLSRIVNERGTYTMRSGVKGTRNWNAPELLTLDPRGTVKSDVFSLGLVFGYLLLGGQHLYGSKYEIDKNIIEGNMININRKYSANRIKCWIN